MKSVLFLTHENISKTAVAKAMFYDIALEIKNDFNVTFFSAKECGKNSTINDQKINFSFFEREKQGKIFLKDILNLVLCLFSLISMIKKNDIIYVRSYPMMIMIYIPLLFLNKKTIFDTRGLFFEELFDSQKIKRNKLLTIAFKFIECRILNASNNVICVSESQKKYYQELTLKPIYKVVYNGAKKVEKIIEIEKEKKYTIGYVGSLVSWHLPERISEILNLLQQKGIDFEFHCITRDIDIANNVFNDIKYKKIYSHQYREIPIKFDLGFCLIKDTLSKTICFPVKFAEYLSSGTKVVFSDNVNVCKLLNEKYDLGLEVNLNDSNDIICDKIKYFLESNNDSWNDLPEELTFSFMISNIRTILEELS